MEQKLSPLDVNVSSEKEAQLNGLMIILILMMLWSLKKIICLSSLVRLRFFFLRIFFPEYFLLLLRIF